MADVVLALMGTGAIAAAYVTGMNFFNNQAARAAGARAPRTHRTRAIRLF